MTRGGAAKLDDTPERRCIATGESQPKAGLIRFVISPDGVVVPDLLERLPGRGIWCAADRDALALAIKKNLFSRAAKTQVTVPADLAQQVETVLTRRVTDLIALARKSGEAVAGFEKVKDWLATRPVRVLLQASDGSMRGKSKLWTPQGARYFDCLTAEELGLAFGRQTVIHGALATGGLGNRVVEEAAKLQALRPKAGTIDGNSVGKEQKDA